MKKKFYDQRLIETEPVMNKRQLKRKIEKKLDQLSQLLDHIEAARIINSEDPDTWDSDTLYNLAENLKETLQLLEDQVLKGKYEDGLCSLVDSYQEDSD
jgi:hypothetical protein